jgi:hypothetical protein
MNGKAADVMRIDIYGLHTFSPVLSYNEKKKSIDQRRRDGWQNRENSVKRSFI